jgi:hypothetical protein
MSITSGKVFYVAPKNLLVLCVAQNVLTFPRPIFILVDRLASFQKRKDYLDAVAPDGCSTQR